MKIILLTLLLTIYADDISFAQEMPLVYGVENTGAECPQSSFPSLSNLAAVESLPDPFLWSDVARGRITSHDDWRCRRAEIAAQVQYYELGTKPAPPGNLAAGFSADSVLTVTVIEGTGTLTLTCKIALPHGKGPFSAGLPGKRRNLVNDQILQVIAILATMVSICVNTNRSRMLPRFLRQLGVSCIYKKNIYKTPGVAKNATHGIFPSFSLRLSPWQHPKCVVFSHSPRL
jgi:hypothetical protein